MRAMQKSHEKHPNKNISVFIVSFFILQMKMRASVFFLFTTRTVNLIINSSCGFVL